MGNCSLKGVTGECSNSIRVLTDAGEIIDIKGPKLAREIVNDFPGYAVCKRGKASFPLPEDECLVNGGFYYLLPLEKVQKSGTEATGVIKKVNEEEEVKKIEVDWMNHSEPSKMSFADFVENLSNGSAMEVLPSQKKGVWKVKLVISSQQLGDILSEQVNTEALIEKMRMAAASSAPPLTPKRSKSSWVVGWKRALSNVFKVPIENNKAP